MEHEKLVRDKIPDIIRRKGENPVYRRASDEEYVGYLANKVVEEAEELRRAILQTREDALAELADADEVRIKVMELFGISESDVAEARARKLSERGGFKERWILTQDSKKGD